MTRRVRGEVCAGWVRPGAGGCARLGVLVPSVTAAQARAFVMAKQGLAGPGAGAVEEATFGTAGVPSASPTCYLSYAARVSEFQFAALDEKLYLERCLARVRCMRQGVFIEPVEVLPTVLAATGDDLPAERSQLLDEGGLDARAHAALSARIEEAVAEAPLAIAEIKERLGRGAPRKKLLARLVDLMCREARLVRAHTHGDDFTYARWNDWFSDPAAEVDPASARVELARRYLRAFGPATTADLAWWAGWSDDDATAALRGLGHNLSGVTIDGELRCHVLMEELLLLGVTEPDELRSVRLLPVWDTYLMGRSDRRHVVQDEDAGRVFDREGNATSTVIVDGVACGVWECEEAANAAGRSLTVRISGFRPELEDRWQDVVDAAARLGFALRADELRIERMAAVPPIAEAKPNAFLAPIRLTTFER